MYYSQTARLAIYAEGELGRKSKTAEGVIRYGKNPIVAVIDSSKAGKKVGDVLPLVSDIPVVASIDDCLADKPEALLLGTAWSGGRLPEAWRADIKKAIRAGMDIINGLHDFLTDDAEIVEEAARYNRKLLDVRKPPDDLPVAMGKALACKSEIVLTVGSDCSVGKMTASLEIVKVAQARRINAGFVATGQTGIMIDGAGIAIDRVIGDFMAGATEQMVVECAAKHELVLVEGQGSLVHPGFSGVTLALLHGSCPSTMVLCHKAAKTHIGESEFPITPLAELVKLYEYMASHMRKAKVVAIALNTAGMSDEQSAAECAKYAGETGLPCCDPVRHGGGQLLDAILKESRLLQAGGAR